VSSGEGDFGQVWISFLSYADVQCGALYLLAPKLDGYRQSDRLFSGKPLQGLTSAALRQVQVGISETWFSLAIGKRHGRSRYYCLHGDPLHSGKRKKSWE
jgi:hypothetical protein